ncbi:MAG: alkaline phosphatase family protein [Candidatus Lokiarchaeota archaeon]|nr:alkaline phosphatase family protein [Candidatus Lokiarchaeota archaeon]
MSRSARVNQVILIILDDVRAEHLFKWMKEGKLPNIAQLADNGVSCKNTVTSFPSVTLPCYADIITGSNSGYFPKEGSGVPNYHWIDRTIPSSVKKKPPLIRNYSERRDVLKINKDIGKNVKTIFEQAGDGNFLSATSFLYRGSTFTTSKEFKPELILKRIEDIYNNPKELFSNKEVPKVSVGYVPHTDDLMHKKGFDHPDYINLVIRCDEFIGSLIKTLKETGYYEDTAIAITTDHGNYKAPNIFDLEPFFKEKGLKPYNPIKGSGDFDANLGGVGFFNFRGDSWFHHPTVNQMKEYNTSEIGATKMNLFEILWDIPGIELMYYKDDNNNAEKGIIHLERRDLKINKISRGRIEYSGYGKHQKTKYVFDDDDLFGYVNSEKSCTLLDNKSHTINEWIEATYQTNFINLIDQLPRHFKNPRSCDIMVSNTGLYNYNYEHGHTKGTSPFSHDIASQKSMFVPLIIGGSLEIPKMELEVCKTTDIVPTLLDLLGKEPHSSVLGESVLN